MCIKGQFDHVPKHISVVDLHGLQGSNVSWSKVAECLCALGCDDASFCLPHAMAVVASLARDIVAMSESEQDVLHRQLGLHDCIDVVLVTARTHHSMNICPGRSAKCYTCHKGCLDVLVCVHDILPHMKARQRHCPYAHDLCPHTAQGLP